MKTRRDGSCSSKKDPTLGPFRRSFADPKRQGELILETDYVRLYDAARADGSSFPLISGKVLGGGSSVNNLGVMRALRRDFDAWQRFGGEAWSYEALLPVARALEDDPDFPDPPVVAMMAVAEELGIPRCEDLAVPEPYGLCMSPYNLVDGRRQSAVKAFLDPVRDRPNLAIRASTKATRLILEGQCVTGIEVIGPDGPATIEADRVVVSAGSYQTPHLLLLSGIGPPSKIEAVRLPVEHRLDGVGENFQDHAVVYLTFRGSAGLREDHLIPKIRLFVASSPNVDHGDLHILLHPSIRVEGMAPLLPVSVRLLEDRARGRLWLASADPHELPAIDPGILRDPRDQQAMLNGMRFTRDFVRHPRMAEFYGELVIPEADDDETWLEHATSSHITYNHATGTCRLGPPDDPLAVVGPDLRVHGIENLWLADMSVIPVIPHAPTNATAYLVGSIAARNLA